MPDKNQIDNLEPVAEIYEQTDSCAERMRVLCMLAESLDESEIKSLKDDADNAFAFPSLSKMSKGEAEVIMDRIEAIREFREALEEV